MLLLTAEQPLDQTEASEQQPSSAEDVAKRARDLGVRAITVHANVAEQSDINNLFATAKKESGRIDIVMSDSGIEHFANVESVTGEEFDKVIALNVKAQFFVAQTALTALKYLDDGGRVILISSISAVMVRRVVQVLHLGGDLLINELFRALPSTPLPPVVSRLTCMRRPPKIISLVGTR